MTTKALVGQVLGTTINIAPGFVVLDATTVGGGVTYDRVLLDERSINGGEGQETEHKVDKRVDHVALVHESEQLASRARYVVKRSCTLCGAFYFADDAQVAQLAADWLAVESWAMDFNLRASEAGSARRVHVAYLQFPLAVDNIKAVQQCAKTVRECLQALREALRSGDGKAIANAVARSKNLDRLATGVQADSIRYALECVAAAKAKLREAEKAKQSPESAGRSLDLDAIEAAEALFTMPETPPAPVDMGDESLGS